MEIKTVGPRSSMVGLSCRGGCKNKVRAGEVILFTRLATNHYRDGSFALHVNCVRALLDRAPEGVLEASPDAQIAALRVALLAAGAVDVSGRAA